MLNKTISTEDTPHSLIPAMIELLKSAPNQVNIRALMEHHLTTAVQNQDSEEVFYWAVIHYGVVGGTVDPALRDVLVELLNRAALQQR
ncbi:MAG: hypothetical protein LCH61_04055 [Proteobacteria bacterium]|nr:hypothetical protein [Pseudomonadota bacterium]